MKIGVISDTHGILESKVLDLFQGAQRILHAGDVGNREILVELSAVAPVTAVWGNTDEYPLRQQLKEAEVLNLGVTRILITHQVGHPERLSLEVSRHLEASRPNIVIFGHTHRPYDQMVGNVRYFNPGGSGPRRFGLPRTVAVLRLTPTEVEAEFLPLD